MCFAHSASTRLRLWITCWNSVWAVIPRVKMLSFMRPRPISVQHRMPCLKGAWPDRGNSWTVRLRRNCTYWKGSVIQTEFLARRTESVVLNPRFCVKEQFLLFWIQNTVFNFLDPPRRPGWIVFIKDSRDSLHFWLFFKWVSILVKKWSPHLHPLPQGERK